MARLRADAVVVGSGILGASTAHFLAKAGVGHVIVVEKGRVCSGSTQFSAGVVRQHYSNDVTIQLALRALEMFENSERELGGPTGFLQCGYLIIASAAEEASIRTNLPLQQELGVGTEMLEPSEIATRYPSLDISDIVVGALEDRSGYAHPIQTVMTLLRSAAPWNLRVWEDTEVIGIHTEDGRVTGVATTGGDVVTPIVVNCAGAGAPRIGEMVGIDYSLAFSREHGVVFEISDELGGLPLVADAPNTLYFRPDGPGRLLVGQTYPKDQEPCDPETYDLRADPEVVRSIADRLASRVPSLRDALAADDYSGLLIDDHSGVYEITDDWHPIVGPSSELEGYFAAFGGSGHCFKIGPAIGETLADVIAGRDPKIDLAPLAHERFAAAQPMVSAWGPGSRA